MTLYVVAILNILLIYELIARSKSEDEAVKMQYTV